MRICHFVERESFIEGGIKSSVRHQRIAMEKEGISYTTDPDEEFDILHLNVLGPKSLYHLRKAKKNDIPVIYHTHTTGADFRDSWKFSNVFSPLVDRYSSYIYDKADVLVAPSRYTKNYLQKRTSETAIRVISNGIDTEQLDDGRDSDEETFTVTNLGLILERKGLSTFTDTVSQLPSMNFTWYGPRLDWFLEPRMTKKAIRTSPDNVSFPGFIEDKNKAFAADAFFFPSRKENEGISVLEAAYCGLPLILRDIPTYKEWIKDDVHCLKGSETGDFVEHLRRLQNDPDLRHRLANNAKTLASKHSLDNVGKALRVTYESVIQNPEKNVANGSVPEEIELSVNNV